jgi:CheY-like chemotaxis protein
MYNLLIISEVKSFFIKVIRDKLKALSFNTDVLQAEMETIHNYTEKLNGILIYADEHLVEQSQAIIYIKDRALADDVPIFVIGDVNEIKTIKGLITQQLLRKEFQRPIDILKVVDTINTFTVTYSQQKKILAVDDSGSMLRSVKEWLEGKYNVYLANSAAMAIKYLSLNKPDLVLLDYEMPVVDGKQVLEMIRTETEFADIPVMFLTNRSGKDGFDNVKYLNPEGYLLKSMDSSQIISAINAFFEKQKMNMY